MAKFAKIESCCECPHYLGDDTYISLYQRMCDLETRRFTSEEEASYHPPYWCPLPDEDEYEIKVRLVRVNG